MIFESLEYTIEVIQKASRESQSTYARWRQPARLRISCGRCLTSTGVFIEVSELQASMPRGQYAPTGHGETYMKHCPSAKTALERLSQHHCYPPSFRSAIRGRVDGNASQQEQYEALSVVFAELALKEQA